MLFRSLPEEVILADPLDGRGATALFRLGAPPRQVVIDAPESNAGVAVTLAIRWLRCGREPPLGAAGIVMSAPAAAREALRELADHRDHYLASARRDAACVFLAHEPEAVLRTLLS